MTPLVRCAVGVGALLFTVAACTSDAPPRSPAGAAYLAIATPANEQLDKAFDALDGRDRDRMAASVQDLRAIAGVERSFDRKLRALSVPAEAEATIRALIALNEYRAALTMQVASSTDLVQLKASKPNLSAANDPVEQQVRVLRTELELPPPDTD
jgi:hypothetical protein